MASELCMNCFSVKGQQYEVCPYCGYVEGTPPKQPHYLTPGMILGSHFIVGTVIGFGGFGITYQCFDITLGVRVAVKEFYPAGLVNRAPGECKVGLLSGEKQQQYRSQLKRFLMEARSVAQFGKAKDIVNVYDFFEENNTAYIIMEYIDGILLKDYLEKQGRLHPEAAMCVITPIIAAVKKIHSKGIIHRDISPDNIFITSEDAIKVFDFGAAQLNDSTEGMAGETVIKVGYSAPEQYRDKSKQGYYTDIYSVGAILYQMLTGIQPIESTEREFKDTLKSPLELGVKISGNVDRAVMEALAVKPELRFQAVWQLEDALHNKRVAEYPRDKLRKRKRRRTGVISFAVLAVLAVGVGIGLYSTVLRPENRIFDSSVREDTITVWVENKDQKKQLEELVEDGFKQGGDSGQGAQDSDEIRAMQRENEKVEVAVEVQPQMEEALQKARSSNAFPNMFLTDHVTDLAAYDPVSLEDNVYAAMESEDYLYMSHYPEYFTGMTEMPTGLDTLLCYACDIGYSKNGRLQTSDYYQEREENTVELNTLFSLDGSADRTKGGRLSRKLGVFAGASKAYAMLLQNEDWSKVFTKREIPDETMCKNLAAIQRFNAIASREEKYQINKKRKTGLYGSNIVAGVTYRTALKQAASRDQSEKEKGMNPLNGYQPYVVTNEGKMLIALSERYAIAGQSSENQKTACMRLLWVMLSEKGQEKKAGPGQTAYPIRSDYFYKFDEFNAGFGGLEDLVRESRDCVVVGRETGTIRDFVNGLGTVSSEKSVQDYCAKFGQKEEEK